MLGQTTNTAIIVKTVDDLDKIDFYKPIYIYSQTTKSPKEYKAITNKIEERIRLCNGAVLKYVVHDTLCRQVSGREPQLKSFSRSNDVIVFVSGEKSSNGKMLYKSCKEENINSYFISDLEDIRLEWFLNVKSVGICGATSTPRWLMEKVQDRISKIV